MVRVLSNNKRRLSCLKPIDDARTTVLKKLKESRHRVIRQSLNKLKMIPDAEQCLRQAVLIRNTFHCAKQLSPREIEKHLQVK